MLSSCAIIKGLSISSGPRPLTKIYSSPILSTGAIWSIPPSWPPGDVSKLELLPVNEPLFTAIGLSDSTRTPINPSALSELVYGDAEIR